MQSSIRYWQIPALLESSQASAAKTQDHTAHLFLCLLLLSLFLRSGAKLHGFLTMPRCWVRQISCISRAKTRLLFDRKYSQPKLPSLRSFRMFHIWNYFEPKLFPCCTFDLVTKNITDTMSTDEEKFEFALHQLSISAFLWVNSYFII